MEGLLHIEHCWTGVQQHFLKSSYLVQHLDQSYYLSQPTALPYLLHSFPSLPADELLTMEPTR